MALILSQKSKLCAPSFRCLRCRNSSSFTRLLVTEWQKAKVQTRSRSLTSSCRPCSTHFARSPERNLTQRLKMQPSRRWSCSRRQSTNTTWTSRHSNSQFSWSQWLACQELNEWSALAFITLSHQINWSSFLGTTSQDWFTCGHVFNKMFKIKSQKSSLLLQLVNKKKSFFLKKNK